MCFSPVKFKFPLVSESVNSKILNLIFHFKVWIFFDKIYSFISSIFNYLDEKALLLNFTEKEKIDILQALKYQMKPKIVKI